jgi:hypothetical protein
VLLEDGELACILIDARQSWHTAGDRAGEADDSVAETGW